MKKYNYSLVFAVIVLLFFIGCNAMSSPFKGYFSQKYDNLEEPETEDERTLVSEYQDYIKLVDSLASVWDSSDTLAMRRLYYNQYHQADRVEKVSKYNNIRNSLTDKTKSNMKSIKDEIFQKLSSETRNELYSFYEFFEKEGWRYTGFNDFEKVVDGNIYQNSYGEHFFLIKDNNYDYWPKRVDAIYKKPIKKESVDVFKKSYKEYRKYNK